MASEATMDAACPLPMHVVAWGRDRSRWHVSAALACDASKDVACDAHTPGGSHCQCHAVIIDDGRSGLSHRAGVCEANVLRLGRLRWLC